jgi:hypothetical protein
MLAAFIARPSDAHSATPSRSRGDEDAGAPTKLAAQGEDPAALKHPKLDSALAAVAREARGGGDGVEAARRRGLPMRDRFLRVEVVAQAPAAAVGAIAAAGGRVEGEYRGLIQALLPAAAAERVAAEPSVRYVRPARADHPEIVAGEGVGVTGAGTWHAAGALGVGARVGVIDGDFLGYRQRQASGDLPPTLVTQNYCPAGLENGLGEGHGTAVAEIVHEVAPAAQLYLICAGTQVEKGLALEYAKAQGIRVVNNSSGAFNTGRGDGSGGPGTAEGLVADARTSGILWVNSAGNYAQRHWSGAFADTDGDGAHNYTPTDEGNTFVIPAGGTVTVYLKWDAWPVTGQDFDLYLVLSASNAIAAASTSDQTGSQPPTEALAYTNTTGSAQTYFIGIVRWSGSAAPRLDVFALGDVAGGLEYVVPEGSLSDYASSPQSFAAAAICWQNSQLEPYSSRGPTVDGRVKPDISGPDSVSSATYGAFSGCGGSGFTGTSAAAPHAAGAAALVQAANPAFGPDQLQGFLEGRAADLGPPGRDIFFGAGRLSLGAAPLPPISCSPRPRVTITAVPAGGRLAVTVGVTDAANRLLGIAFGAGARQPTNALLDLPDGRVGMTGTPVYTPPVGATQATFHVRRATAGLATTVPMVVTDRCGTWETLAGGGVAAGF